MKRLLLIPALAAGCTTEPTILYEQALEVSPTVVRVHGRVGEEVPDGFELRNRDNDLVSFIVDAPVLSDRQGCASNPWLSGRYEGTLGPGAVTFVPIVYRPSRLERCDAVVTVRVQHDAFADPDDPVLTLIGVPHGTDADEDGFAAEEGERIETDCNDNDPSAFPGADERCNDLDDDCDGEIDEADSLPEDPEAVDARQWFPDSDGDGYPASGPPVWSCRKPDNYLAPPADDLWDCDDRADDIHPGIVDVVDGVDRNCDNMVACYADVDEDGYGDSIVNHPDIDPQCIGPGVDAGGTPIGVTRFDGDCDDTRGDVNPAEVEVCDDGLTDENCNGFIDDSEIGRGQVYGLVEWYPDADGDFFGRDDVPGQLACPHTRLPGTVRDNSDCDDANEFVHPSTPGNPVTETPGDGLDQDCDGLEACFVDGDRDGVGVLPTINRSDLSCTTLGVAPIGDDCDDRNPQAYPGAPELVATGVDEDCDNREICYADGDNDGFGTPTTAISAVITCVGPGVSLFETDCNDGNATAYPDALETCDGIDNDCDRLVDDDDDAGLPYLQDADADSFGAADRRVVRCAQPVGYVPEPTVIDLSSVDCNDNNPFSYPGAPEVIADGIDQDCDLQELCFPDVDQDGFGDDVSAANAILSDLACAELGVSDNNDDCNDADLGINPLVAELCEDGLIDENCNGLIDNEELSLGGVVGLVAWSPDSDGDGFGRPDAPVQYACPNEALPGTVRDQTDCNDADPLVHPSTPADPVSEIPGDGVDQDCDAFEDCYTDADRDNVGVLPLIRSTDLTCGTAGRAAIEGDCDDLNGAAFPGAPELVASGADEDCNGEEICYADGDRDGFGISSTLASLALDCRAPGVSPTDDDCADGDNTSYPGGTEICDGADNDCDGLLDDEDGAGDPWLPDIDADGFGDLTGLVVSCTRPSQYLPAPAVLELSALDCNDADPFINPAATETIANGVDEDCNLTEMCWPDVDNDGFGTTVALADAVEADLLCSPAGASRSDADCDDTDPTISPLATETCDDGTVDENCNGLIDNDEIGINQVIGLVAWVADSDGDGFGRPDAPVQLSCDYAGPPGTVRDQTDCNDADATIFPDTPTTPNPEIPVDGIDQNCDGLEDCFTDVDRDNSGVLPYRATTDITCTTAGNAAVDGDCDDRSAITFPGAEERVASNKDEDCDGQELCYVDDDGDSYGTPFTRLSSTLTCVDTGVSPLSTDCEDGDATAFPGGIEVCDGVDNDCDGRFDDDDGAGDPWIPDIDADGYGDLSGLVVACTQPSQYLPAPAVLTLANLDCDDADPFINPAATETIANNIDEDCDLQELCWPDADLDGFGDEDAVAADAILSDLFCSPEGVSDAKTDCDDSDAAISPNATERCDSDATDENCNGLFDNEELAFGNVIGVVAWVADSDGDGFGRPDAPIQLSCPHEGPPGTVRDQSDCNDADPTIHPNTPADPVVEGVGDGRDQDCDGLEACYTDTDRDGVGVLPVVLSTNIACLALGTSAVDGDCDDDDAITFPGATEQVASNKDENCDGTELCYVDGDNDDYGDAATAISADLSCLAAGFSDNADDCDDSRTSDNPEGIEVCDGRDNDCDALVDDDDDAGVPYLPDIDSDGFGDASGLVVLCTQPAFTVPAPATLTPATVDCDDRNVRAYPGAPEIIANGTDEDCDQFELCWPDVDNDGYGANVAVGDAVVADLECTLTGSSDNDEDCNDANRDVRPNVLERCDGVPGGPWVDDDCDGFADDLDPEGTANPDAFYVDNDGDGFGTGTAVIACYAPADHADQPGDCNDVEPAINPNAEEVCGGRDEDCDGLIDDQDFIDLTDPAVGWSVYYLDADQDGHGDERTSVRACVPPSGFLANGNDCDDTNPFLNPSVAESPGDSVDSNCDGLERCYEDQDGDGIGIANTIVVSTSISCELPGVSRFDYDCDDDDPARISDDTLWFADFDGDGLGNPLINETSCLPPSVDAWVNNPLDCDDTSSEVGSAVSWFFDGDADGFGDNANTIAACTAPPFYVPLGDDCNDNSPIVFPFNPEACDNIDNDCDGQIDETLGQTYYFDQDNDGFGDRLQPLASCSGVPAGHVSLDTDCDDRDNRINPGAQETCDAVDNDCDGDIDVGATDCPLAVQPVFAPNGDQYLVVPAFVRLAEAELACNDVGYKLVSLETQAEEDFLFGAVGDAGVVPERFWISMYDPCPPGTPGPATGIWSWYDGINDICSPLDPADPYYALRLTNAPLPPADVYASAPTALIPQPTWQFFAPGVGRRAYVCELP